LDAYSTGAVQGNLVKTSESPGETPEGWLRMGYCQDFDHDIFISYAHADNWDHWIDDLHNALKARLPEDMFKPPEIWIDAGGLDGKTIDGGIQSALQSSACLVAVVSGAFLYSTYCVPIEVSNFRHPHFPPVIRDVSRVISVAYRIPDEHPIPSWPELLRGVQAVRFDSPAGPHLRPPRRDPSSLYWIAMEDLVRKIMVVLKELKKGLGGAEVATMEPPAALPTNGGVRKTAYQAVWKPKVHVTYDRTDKSQTDKLVGDLASDCELVTVLPRDSSPERRARYLQNADGHILMFNRSQIDWAEDLAPESVAIAAEQGRPKRVGLLSDCPDEFAVHSPIITPITPGVDGLKAFVSTLKAVS
jgi:hypothetical protein